MQSGSPQDPTQYFEKRCRRPFFRLTIKSFHGGPMSDPLGGRGGTCPNKKRDDGRHEDRSWGGVWKAWATDCIWFRGNRLWQGCGSIIRGLGNLSDSIAHSENSLKSHAISFLGGRIINEPKHFVINVLFDDSVTFICFYATRDSRCSMFHGLRVLAHGLDSAMPSQGPRVPSPKSSGVLKGPGSVWTISHGPWRICYGLWFHLGHLLDYEASRLFGYGIVGLCLYIWFSYIVSCAVRERITPRIINMNQTRTEQNNEVVG